MPAMIRNSEKMWDKNGELRDTKAVIPDSSYASVYSAVIDFCKKTWEHLIHLKWEQFRTLVLWLKKS